MLLCYSDPLPAHSCCRWPPIHQQFQDKRYLKAGDDKWAQRALSNHALSQGGGFWIIHSLGGSLLSARVWFHKSSGGYGDQRLLVPGISNLALLLLFNYWSCTFFPPLQMGAQISFSSSKKRTTAGRRGRAKGHICQWIRSSSTLSCALGQHRNSIGSSECTCECVSSLHPRGMAITTWSYVQEMFSAQELGPLSSVTPLTNSEPNWESHSCTRIIYVFGFLGFFS